MNARERFRTVMEFGRPDRTLLWEMGYWPETLERWYGEGLKRRENPDSPRGAAVRGEASPHDPFSARVRDADVRRALGFDPGLSSVAVNCGPAPLFEEAVFEETAEFVIYQDEYGVRKRLNKLESSVPQFIDWQVAGRADFERLKEERFRPGLQGRVPPEWPELVKAYAVREFPLTIGGYPYGFYGFLRYLMGEERLLFNLYDDPALVRDMMSFLADFWMALWEEVLAQVEVDCAHFWEDMAYRSGPLISPAMFRELMSPCYRRLTAFLRQRGVQVILVDTDGNLRELIPLFLEAGLSGVWPVEVQAGNDPLQIRRLYPRLHMLGGLDKLQIARGGGAIAAELEGRVPQLLASGGYIPHLDHHAHPQISWADFRAYRGRLEELVRAAGSGR